MNKVIIRVLPSLELRQLEVADTASLFALTEANRTYLREWLPWLDHVTRPEGSQRFIEAAAKQAAEGTALALGILVENDLQGVIGYNQITPQNRCATIGYWIAEPMQGRGIMTAACQALVDYGFTHLGLNRQVIACAVGNRLRGRMALRRLR
jgi:ribosomal-protein-serine acetyltransferase